MTSIELGARERSYLTSLYRLHNVNEDISAKVKFLKSFTGYTNVAAAEGNVDMSTELRTLELALIADLEEGVRS